jgi:hypothetical protein
MQDAPQMTTSHNRPVPYNVLQEYLQALADVVNDGPSDRQLKILLSYAELQYQLHGGGRCSMCHASVRHALPVTAEHTDGTIAEFGCLCMRCLEGERVVSNRVTLIIGRARLEYTTADGGPQPRSFRAYAT